MVLIIIAAIAVFLVVKAIPAFQDDTENFFTYKEWFTDGDTPIRLWISTDRGATWSVRSTATTHRHGHAVVADPFTGDVWVMYGDRTSQSGLWRSSDRGATFFFSLKPHEAPV